ncbi:TonB-dependent siderophore receptor [Methylobacillus pratensis]
MSLRHQPQSTIPQYMQAENVSPRPRIHHAVHAAVLAIGMAAGAASWHEVHAEQVTSQTEVRELNIAAGSLAAAITEFAVQTGINITTEPALVKAQETRGLKGSYTVAQGLSALLSPLGLQAVRQEEGNYIVKTIAQSDVEVPTAILAELTVKAQGMGESTENTQSYAARLVSVGSKTPTSLRETPQSVSVVTSQLIQDKRMTDLTEAMKITPGITVQNTNYRINSFYSRGFLLDNYQIDGASPMAMSTSAGSFYGIGTFDLVEFDHVEVLRGSSSLFGGAGNPGGIVNLVRKRPTRDTQFKVDASAGSWDNYRVQLDASGSLTEAGNLRGRLVAAHADRQYFIDNRSTEKPIVYGILEFDLTPDTMVTLGGRYERIHENGTWSSVPRYSTGEDLKLKRSTGLTQSWSYTDASSKELFAKFDHVFKNQWKLNATYTGTHEKVESLGAFALNGVNPVTLAGPIWTGSYNDSWTKQSLFDTNLSGSFNAFSREHEFVLGADWQRVTSQWRGGAYPANRGLPANVFDPSSTYWNPYPISSTLTIKYNPNTQVQYGIYARTALQVSDQAKLILGGRLARYKFEQTIDDGVDISRIEMREPTKFVPYAALTYELDKQWSAYASYSEIFKPQQNLLQGPEGSAKTVNAMTGKTYEIGLKGDLFNGAVNTGAAVFYTKREDGAILDTRYPNNSVLFGGSCCYLNQGEVVSKGVELEASGEILPGLMTMASYVYNYNRNLADSLPLSTITPKHMVKLWTVYQLPGNYSKWRVGGGVNLQSTTYVSGVSNRFDGAGNVVEANIPFKYTQSGYAIWDAMVEYQVDKNWSLNLNANNLFDKTYYQTVGSAGLGNYYGTPRNVMLTVRGTF